MTADDAILTVSDLKTHFPVRRGVFSRTIGSVKAVDGVSFGVRRGRTLGLVGESGCGKTTVARTVLRLIPATAGRVLFDGTDLFALRRRRLRRMRRQMQIIFQDPVSSLNPRMTVGNIVGEPLTVHRIARGARRRKRVADLFERVGLPPADMSRYPNAFSGGQRQRIGIARALALEPKLIVCDEPVSALDVSIQSQILNLLKDLQDEFSLTYLFIAHDLAVVEFFCDTVAVMYMGQIVEKAPADRLYKNPLHPYTHLLMSAIPSVDPEKKKQPIKSEPPKITDIPRACPFHPRCSHATQKCKTTPPPLTEPEPNHLVACWHRDT